MPQNSAIFQGCFAILHFLSQDGSQMCWQEFSRTQETLPDEGVKCSHTVQQRHSSESGDQWAQGAIPFMEVSIGAVVPSSLHMIQYLSMWDVWYPSVVGWPGLAARLSPIAHLPSSLTGRGKRIGRSRMRKLMCWNEDRDIQLPPWAKYARLQEILITILPIIYIFNWLFG